MNKHQHEANLYDKVFKENIDAVIENFIKKILKIEVEKAEKITFKLQRTREREADFLKKITNKKGENFILHLEYQTHNEPEMVNRMLDYCSLLLHKYHLPIEQYVLYLGKDKPTMPTKLKYKNLQFHYHIIDIKQIDYQNFINSESPEEILLAILANFKGDNTETVVRKIVSRLEQTVNLSLESEKIFQQLLILGRLRNLENQIQIIMNVISKYLDIKDDFLYKQGEEEGVEKGIEKGIEKGMEKGMEKIILNFLMNSKLTVEQIAEYAGVSLTYVIAIKQKNNL
jgi:predicted transposase/invertase (TIGR01784 family)